MIPLDLTGFASAVMWWIIAFFAFSFIAWLAIIWSVGTATDQAVEYARENPGAVGRALHKADEATTEMRKASEDYLDVSEGREPRNLNSGNYSFQEDNQRDRTDRKPPSIDSGRNEKPPKRDEHGLPDPDDPEDWLK